LPEELYETWQEESSETNSKTDVFSSVKTDFLDDDNVNTKETTKDIIKEFIEGKNMINDCFRITGGEDYFIESLFTNMSEVYNFSDSLKENSIEIKEFHVVEILCKEKLIRETYLMNRS